MRTSFKCMLFVAIFSVCGRRPPARTPINSVDTLAGPAYVESFLKAWLLSASPVEAETFLNPAFHQQSESVLPSSDRRLPPEERVLLYARNCAGAPQKCLTLEQCIRPMRSTIQADRPYNLETVTVTDEVVASNEYLRPLKGHQIGLVSFILNGCNIGVWVVIRVDSQLRARVLSISYLAG